MARGVVKFFKPEKGWGAISCDEIPNVQDVWVHFSYIEAAGYRSLEAGDVVDFDYEPARQDSFNFRATRPGAWSQVQRQSCVGWGRASSLHRQARPTPR